MNTSQTSQDVPQLDASGTPPSRADKSRISRDAPILKEHLDQLFPPLNFPPELSTRILTHSSHPDAAHSHNARLSFIGRRVLQTYLLLFLHDASSLRPAHEYELIAERTLNTYVLGEYLAPRWNLGKVLKWTPATNALAASASGDRNLKAVLEKLGPENGRSIGLYKVQGTAVEAIVGGVFHQFGGSIAHRLFHTRVLPSLLLPGNPQGLSDVFHYDAKKVCEIMGGENGALVIRDDTSQALSP